MFLYGIILDHEQGCVLFTSHITNGSTEKVSITLNFIIIVLLNLTQLNWIKLSFVGFLQGGFRLPLLKFTIVSLILAIFPVTVNECFHLLINDSVCRTYSLVFHFQASNLHFLSAFICRNVFEEHVRCM